MGEFAGYRPRRRKRRKSATLISTWPCLPAPRPRTKHSQIRATFNQHQPGDRFLFLGTGDSRESNRTGEGFRILPRRVGSPVARDLDGTVVAILDQGRSPLAGGSGPLHHSRISLLLSCCFPTLGLLTNQHLSSADASRLVCWGPTPYRIESESCISYSVSSGGNSSSAARIARNVCGRQSTRQPDH